MEKLGCLGGTLPDRKFIYHACLLLLLTRPFAYKESNRAQQMNMQLPPTGYCQSSAVLPYHHSVQTGCG